MIEQFRYAARTLLKAPGFSAVAMVTLAIGIGANTAIFSVVNGVLLRPLPFGDPGRIVQVWTSTAGEPRSSHSAGDFQDLQRENTSLAGLAGYRAALFTAFGQGSSDPASFEGAFVTSEFFDVLQVTPLHGRVFTRNADHGSGESAVILSRSVWEQLYGSSPGAVGQRLRLNGEPHTVLGVLPGGVEWPDSARVWILSKGPVPPSPLDIDEPGVEREVRYFEAIARLRPDVTLAQAQDDLARLGRVIHAREGRTSEVRGVNAGLLQETLVGDVRRALVIMQAAVGLVLLIACANVSSLFIARAAGRRQELAIRAALGAGRGRLVRQLMMESLLLGGAGGLIGLLLGSWLIVLVIGILPSGIPRVEDIALDRTVAGVTLMVGIGCGVLFGTLPALQASRADAGAALSSRSERTSTSGTSRGRAVLVIVEVALTLVLLVGAGLLINSFLRLQRVESGFATDHVTVMSLAIPQSRYATGTAQAALYRRLVDGLAARPEVQAVGVGFPGPLRGDNARGSFFIEGRVAPPPDDRVFALIGSVSGGYFGALGMPLVAGRTFNDRDTATSPDVAVVSAELARKYWPGESAVGKRLRFDSSSAWRTVVGIVGDARQLGLHEQAPAVLYIPSTQFPLPFTNLAVRSTAPESAVASLMRAEIAAVDPSLPSGEISNLRGILDRSVAEPRFRSFLLGAFACIALVLAAVGVYGLISYSVMQRTREIGIRVALGALPRQVLVPVVREGLVLAAVGIAAGLVGALAVARVLSRFLFGVSATDPATFAAVSIVMLTVSFLASYIPSRRALRVDPIVALRAE
jgi:putative ABC transport system permease protein